MERIDKLLASTGRWSRKEVHDLIKAGRVTADRQIVLRREEKYGEDTVFRVDGEVIVTSKFTYLMLYKPAGLVSATEDPREPTVLSLLPEHLQRIGLFPAGRLDKDTTGLLLLTNDGILAHELLAPQKHVEKSYCVTIAGEFDKGDVAAFRAGMVLADGLKCQPALLEPMGGGRGLVTIHEGKYHQIKRMCAARGKPVTALHRISFGPLILDVALEPGQWRPLREEELEELGVKG